jgi:hypothetical protein
MSKPQRVAFAGAFIAGCAEESVPNDFKESGRSETFSRNQQRRDRSRPRALEDARTSRRSEVSKSDRSYRKSRNDECDVRSRMSTRLVQLIYHCIACTQSHTMVDSSQSYSTRKSPSIFLRFGWGLTLASQKPKRGSPYKERPSCYIVGRY